MPTDVVIIGAGPAGLTLANLLQRNGIGCVVLEARDRSYVEQRQRAGVLDDYGGRIFADAGLAGEILAGAPSETFLELRYEGEPHLLDVPALAGGRAGRIVPQQLLVRRLLATFLAAGGDLHADADGDPFRRRLAKARFDRLFTNHAAGAAFADMMSGVELVRSFT